MSRTRTLGGLGDEHPRGRWAAVQGAALPFRAGGDAAHFAAHRQAREVLQPLPKGRLRLPLEGEEI